MRRPAEMIVAVLRLMPKLDEERSAVHGPVPMWINVASIVRCTTQFVGSTICARQPDDITVTVL